MFASETWENFSFLSMVSYILIKNKLCGFNKYKRICSPTRQENAHKYKHILHLQKKISASNEKSLTINFSRFDISW